MPYSDAYKNAINDHGDTIATHTSIHTDWSASGANEATGGSPAYARQATAFDASASGEMAMTGTEVFDLAADTYHFVGIWSAVTAGTFYGMFPMGGGTANPPVPFFGRNTGDVIVSDAHGFSDTENVVLFGPNLPTGVTEGTVYFVITASANDFQVSLTEGGAAVVITVDGEGIAQRVAPEILNAQGTLTINTATLGLNLLT